MGRTWGVSLIAAAAFAAAAVVALLLWRPHDSDGMLAEAVNDHLRVLYSDHPVEIESGGIHQVKPWFTGRLDFAPVVAFGGDDDFPLEGGAVAYFLDRKAATFIFKRRLHVITLFVFRAEGLPWPALATQPLGGARGTLETSRGFHVHRVSANRWEFVRTEEGWKIKRRTLRPLDGTEPARKILSGALGP